MKFKEWLKEPNHKYPKLSNGEAWATFGAFVACGYALKIAVDNTKWLLDCPAVRRMEREQISEEGKTELHVTEHTVTERVYRPVYVGRNKLYIRKYW